MNFVSKKVILYIFLGALGVFFVQNNVVKARPLFKTSQFLQFLEQKYNEWIPNDLFPFFREKSEKNSHSVKEFLAPENTPLQEEWQTEPVFPEQIRPFSGFTKDYYEKSRDLKVRGTFSLTDDGTDYHSWDFCPINPQTVIGDYLRPDIRTGKCCYCDPSLGGWQCQFNTKYDPPKECPFVDLVVNPLQIHITQKEIPIGLKDHLEFSVEIQNTGQLDSEEFFVELWQNEEKIGTYPPTNSSTPTIKLSAKKTRKLSDQFFPKVLIPHQTQPTAEEDITANSTLQIRVVFPEKIEEETTPIITSEFYKNPYIDKDLTNNQSQISANFTFPDIQILDVNLIPQTQKKEEGLAHLVSLKLSMPSRQNTRNIDVQISDPTEGILLNEKVENIFFSESSPIKTVVLKNPIFIRNTINLTATILVKEYDENLQNNVLEKNITVDPITGDPTIGFFLVNKENRTYSFKIKDNQLFSDPTTPFTASIWAEEFPINETTANRVPVIQVDIPQIPFDLTQNLSETQAPNIDFEKIWRFGIAIQPKANEDIELKNNIQYIPVNPLPTSNE